MDDWLLLQLADSAFPTGGFSHSSGLEAAAQLGEVRAASLPRFLESYVRQVGHAQLPFLSEAHEAHGASGARDVDAACDAFVTAHVANAASRTQGRAFVATCARVFGGETLDALASDIRAKRTPGHLAPVVGASFASLDVDLARSQRLFLFIALRGVTSAAVRLGLTGTHEAQRLQHGFAPLLDEVRATCAGLRVADAAQTAPLHDLFGALHDTLYARMFQS